VKGADGIYALGDCATISQDPMLAKFSDLFRAADENGDGVLSYDEFDKLIRDNKKRYPQLEMYGKLAREMFEEADVNKNGVLELHEFEALLKKVDSKLKQLPATAQVARQEGIYLAKIFNEQARGRAVDDFAYRHMGSLVSLGAQNAVAEFANSTTLEGFSAWWLWRSVYLSYVRSALSPFTTFAYLSILHQCHTCFFLVRMLQFNYIRHLHLTLFILSTFLRSSVSILIYAIPVGGSTA
jgi:NADH:ubiquinone reductase (non-electrogenic)